MLELPPEELKLCFDVDIAYSDRVGRQSARRVTVRKLDFSEDPGSIHGVCHLRRQLRQFRLDRVGEIIDPRTGESPRNASAWLAERARGPQDGVLPPPQGPRILSPVVFVDELARGWAFSVVPAFKTALDIMLERRLLTSRGGLTKQLLQRGISVDTAALVTSSAERIALFKQITDAGIVATRIEILDQHGANPRPAIWLEMQGSPPTCEFSVGDTFYAPSAARWMIWGKALEILEYSIQVTDEEGGRADIELRKYEAGQWAATMKCEIAQSDLAWLLQNGVEACVPDILTENWIAPDAAQRALEDAPL